MIKQIYLLSFLFIFLSCKKEEDKHTVAYKIVVTAGNPSYSLKYSSSGNSTQIVGPITSSSWLSPSVTDRKGGSSVSLTLDGGSGGTYKMYILIDGFIEKEDRMVDPYGPKTITAKIPED